MTTLNNNSVQLHSEHGGILSVWLDTPGRSVNVFDEDMIIGLEQVLEHIHQRFKDQINAAGQAKLVVFRSRKPGCFIAGADVHAIAAMHAPALVSAVIERGQRLMQRVAALPIPTLAVIDGTCMGGGLEFAMACRFRVASSSSKTKLSLPEIRLGLIPGWGGTQRLPKLVGLQRSLKMILKGSSLSASRAMSAGLVDRVLASESFDDQLESSVALIIDNDFQSSVARRRLLERLMSSNSLGRRIVFAMTRRAVKSESRHYPALEHAIAAMEMAYQPTSDGYRFEREAFTKLLFTETARSLLGLFIRRDLAKKVSTWVESPFSQNSANGQLSSDGGGSVSQSASFSRVAIIGAGQMGAGIGVLAAQQGFEVVFKEIHDSAAIAGSERVASLFDKQLAAGRITDKERLLARDRCHFTSRWEDLANCELAIEAALEVDAVKRDVFQQLDHYLPEQAILTSNTSSLNVTRMAMATHRHPRVAGLHFFHPVERMELVEVVRTEMTDDATLAKLLEFVRRLGKTPIVTSDKPGFLVNRVLFPYLGEAVRMVAEGYNIATIDKELKRFGMPMGPLELIDNVGIDIASHVASSLASVQSDAEVPAAFLADMAKRNWLGKKSKLGFYAWHQRRRPNSDLMRKSVSLPPVGEYEKDGLSTIARRLVYPMLNEAVHCLDELVVTQPWMVDLGMVLGTGFAPMHGGPLRLIDKIGAPVVERNLAVLEKQFGSRFIAADGLAARAARQEPFYQISNTNPLNWESNHEPRCTTES